MTPFVSLRGRAVALPAANIDTDVIMPKIFLKGIDRAGLAAGLFHDLRAQPDFALNRPEAQGASILIVGRNFGCGSSREHAVWGLLQYGIRVVIGTSFAGIFADNAANNGLLLVSLTDEQIQTLMQVQCPIDVDLEKQTIAYDDRSFAFSIDPDRRRMLMLGLDRIGETLVRTDAIRAFEKAYFAENPWLETAP